MQIFLIKIIVVVFTLLLAACAVIDSDTMLTPAVVAGKTSVPEAYAPIRNVLFVMCAAQWLAIAFASKLNIFFSRQIVLPLQHLTTQTTVEMSAGNLDTLVKLKRHNESGVLARTFNLITTQLRGLIQERKEEQNFLWAILDTVGALVFVLDTQGRFIRFNRACEQMTGYSAKEVEGKHFWDLFVPQEEVIATKTAFQKLRAAQFPNQYEKYWVVRDGSRRLITWSNTALVDADGSLKYFITTGIDITERKQAEEQLHVCAQRDRLLTEMAWRIRNSLDLKQILNNTVTEVQHFLQADRVFIMINHFCEDLYAQIVAESVAPNWRPIGQWTPRNEEHLREFRAFFAHERVQVIHDTMSGGLTPAIAQDCLEYQIRAFLSIPIMLGDRILALLAVSQCSGPRHWQPFEIDLLEKLGTQVAIAIGQAQLYQQVQNLNASLECQVEERTAQLQQKMQELQALYQTKDVFLHAFSHDLRTPIMGTSLVLKNLLNQSEEEVTLSRSLLERMVQSSDRQLNLINSLLEAHSSEVQGIILHCQPVQLGQMIQRLVEDLEPLVSKNQATLTNLVPDELPIISVDPTQLSRVFENLLTNALKHNQPGLSLTLDATLEVGSIRCTVADDGQGMTKQQCDRLFDLYYRGGDSRHFTGIGLGLYLCREIIMAHGGEIGVISSIGAGTTFWFTLPLTKVSKVYA